jgi:cysteine-rich repeat protein
MFQGRRRTAVRVLLAALLQPLAAQAAVKQGATYATESVGGAIIELYGGNIKLKQRMAFNMIGPATGLCYGGPSDDLYVAVNSPAGDRVYVATEGGNLYYAQPFATGFDAALGLDCTRDRVLLVDQQRGVFDITAGGDFSEVTPFASVNDGNHVDVFTDSSGKIWVSAGMHGLYDITTGGTRTADERVVTYDTAGKYGILGIAEVAGELYITEGQFGEEGRIWNLGGLEAHSALSQNILYTTGIPYMANGLLGVGTELFVTGHPYDCHAGRAAWNVTGPGDVSDQEPHTSNICSACYLMEELAYIHYCGDGIVRPNSDEQCDSAGDSPSCDSDCTLTECGDGHLNAEAREECDDGNIIGGDACSDTCRFVPAPEPMAIPSAQGGTSALPTPIIEQPASAESDAGEAVTPVEEPITSDEFRPARSLRFEVRAGGCSIGNSNRGGPFSALALMLGFAAARRRRFGKIDFAARGSSRSRSASVNIGP